MQRLIQPWQTLEYSLPHLYRGHSWGENSFDESVLKAIEITLPATSSGNPDYEFMTRYICAIKKRTVKRADAYFCLYVVYYVCDGVATRSQLELALRKNIYSVLGWLLLFLFFLKSTLRAE